MHKTITNTPIINRRYRLSNWTCKTAILACAATIQSLPLTGYTFTISELRCFSSGKLRIASVIPECRILLKATGPFLPVNRELAASIFCPTRAGSGWQSSIPCVLYIQINSLCTSVLRMLCYQIINHFLRRNAILQLLLQHPSQFAGFAPA